MHVTASRFTAFLVAIALTAVVAEFFLHDGAHIRVPAMMVSASQPAPVHAS